MSSDLFEPFIPLQLGMLIDHCDMQRDCIAVFKVKALEFEPGNNGICLSHFLNHELFAEEKDTVIRQLNWLASCDFIMKRAQQSSTLQNVDVFQSMCFSFTLSFV